MVGKVWGLFFMTLLQVTVQVNQNNYRAELEKYYLVGIYPSAVLNVEESPERAAISLTLRVFSSATFGFGTC